MPNELGMAHLQTRELLSHLATKSRASSSTTTCKLFRSILKGSLRLIHTLLCTGKADIGIVHEAQQLGTLMVPFKDVVHRGAKLALKAVEFTQPLMHASKVGWIEID